MKSKQQKALAKKINKTKPNKKQNRKHREEMVGVVFPCATSDLRQLVGWLLPGQRSGRAEEQGRQHRAVGCGAEGFASGTVASWDSLDLLSSHQSFYMHVLCSLPLQFPNGQGLLSGLRVLSSLSFFVVPSRSIQRLPGEVSPSSA